MVCRGDAPPSAGRDRRPYLYCRLMQLILLESDTGRPKYASVKLISCMTLCRLVECIEIRDMTSTTMNQCMKPLTHLTVYTEARLRYVIALAGPIPMMIGAELFRQGPRPLAMAVAGVVNWLGTFAIAMGFESVQVRFSLQLHALSHCHSCCHQFVGVETFRRFQFCLHWALSK